jgi:Rieske 2Fe-2S family protein
MEATQQPDTRTAGAGVRDRSTLTGEDYWSLDVFAAEQRTIFHAGWIYACHTDSLPAGHRRVVDLAGESVIVARDVDGRLHAHANVCRHRGSQLCDPTAEAAKGAIRCPYHAWTYGLDGELRATPRVDDAIDRSALGLWPRHVDEWNGMIFVSVAAEPPALNEWLHTHSSWIDQFEALPLGELRVGARTRSVVRANWKIVMENYQECLHCAVVHPELVDLVPIYRTGNVVDPSRQDGAVSLTEGSNSFTLDGTSQLSVLPGIAPELLNAYRGATVFPTVMLDVTATSASITALYPSAPDSTTVIAEYLFAAADVAAAGFDPAAVVDFNELVGRQDYEVCERVQRGVASSAFTTGVLTEKDRLVVDFISHYRTTVQSGGDT